MMRIHLGLAQLQAHTYSKAEKGLEVAIPTASLTGPSGLLWSQSRSRFAEVPRVSLNSRTALFLSFLRYSVWTSHLGNYQNLQ